MHTAAHAFSLTGKIALVTGGSRGIGRACCEMLAAHGATVVVNYANGAVAAQEVVDCIVQKGGRAEAIGFDVSNTTQVDTAFAEVLQRYGQLDVLVANAGISQDSLLLRMPDEDLERLLTVNVRGSLACARAAIRSMIKRRTGRVVFVSSVVGEMGNAGQTAYAASKAAILGAAKSIAREYGVRGVTVNVVSPGFIDTDMTAGLSEATKEQYKKSIPLGRMGVAEDVASAVLYLASDAAGYVTGHVLRVNGGMYC